MTQPTHGLDPNALEAAESAYAKATMDLPRHECENCGGSGVIITGRARGEHADANTCQACGGGGVVVDFPEGWNPMASAITAYLAALSQNPGTSNTSGEAVGVRGLEWGPYGTVAVRAYSACGDYTIEQGAKHWRLYRNTMVPMGAFDSEDEAKAAAQADYEQRVLSSLASSERSGREAVIGECAKVAVNYPFSPEAADHSNQAVVANVSQNIAAAIRSLKASK